MAAYEKSGATQCGTKRGRWPRRRYFCYFLEVGSDSGPTGRVLRVSGRVQDPDPTPWTRHLFGSGSDPPSRVLRSTILATNHPAGTPSHPSTNSYVKTWVRPGPEGFGSGSGYPRVRPEPEGSGSGSDPKPENASGPGRIQPLQKKCF